MLIFWRIIGVCLLGWAAWDVYAGYTILHDVIYRADQPLLYWIATSIWAALGVSCFFSWE